MDFVKKNLMLIIVIAVSLIVSVILLVAVLSKYDGMNKMLGNVEQLKKKIQTLNSEKPAPVEENLQRINADIERMEVKVDRINRIFGKHYRRSLQNFASIFLQDTDKEKAEKELLDKWANFWKTEARQDVSPQILLVKFLNSFKKETIEKGEIPKTMFQGGGGIFQNKPSDAEGEKTKAAEGNKADDEAESAADRDENAAETGKKTSGETGEEKDSGDEVPQDKTPAKTTLTFNQRLQKAYEAFQNTLADGTAEPSNKHTIHDILLDALGVPRKSMSSGDCKAFMYVMQESLAKKMREANISISDDNLKFTFGDYFGKKMPMQEDVPILITHWKLLEDLVYRFIKSGIPQINGISKSGYLGSKSEGFLYFNYTINVSGTLDQIRTLVNMLQESYQENRVYVIKDLQLTKAVDGVKQMSSGADSSALRKHFRELDEGKGSATEDIGEDELKKIKENIGRSIIGVSKECKAEINFEYVIYVGDRF